MDGTKKDDMKKVINLLQSILNERAVKKYLLKRELFCREKIMRQENAVNQNIVMCNVFNTNYNYNRSAVFRKCLKNVQGLTEPSKELINLVCNYCASSAFPKDSIPRTKRRKKSLSYRPVVLYGY